ncbi:Predicted membrane protein [Mycobacterium tuberculosis]|nr:Predicted membrane protein [Mycobacterium tuberculosis]
MVVLKLFFVELADRGGLFRIVSFIAVGALLLLVGYFAPVPPKREEAQDASEKSPTEGGVA